MAPKVLTYHTISPREFKEQLEYLKSRSDVLITFDDGLKDFPDKLIQEYKLPVILFVNPALLGQGNRMSASEVIKISESGVIIGNHGWSHKPLANLTDSEVKSEYEMARDWIKVKIKVNAKPETFALPKGSESAQTREQLGALGAKCVFGAERIDVYPGRSLRYFRLSLNPVFQWLRRNKIFALVTSFVLIKVLLGALLIVGIPNVNLPEDLYIYTGGDDVSYVRQATEFTKGSFFASPGSPGYAAFVYLVTTFTGKTDLPALAEPLIYFNLFLFAPLALLLSLLVTRHYFKKIPHLALAGVFLLTLPYLVWFILRDFSLVNVGGVVDNIGRIQSLHMLGLTVMSDWFALPFALAGFWLFSRQNFFWSGLLLGVSLLVRTQYLVPLVLFTLVLTALGHWRDLYKYVLGLLPATIIQAYQNFTLTGSLFTFPAYQAETNVNIATTGFNISNIAGVFGRIWEHAPLALPVALIFLSSIFLALYLSRKQFSKFDWYALLVLGLLSPASLFLTSAALRNPRYFLPFAPIFIILIIILAVRIHERIRVKYKSNH